MHSVCCCSLPVWRRSFLKKGTPRDLFWPRPGSAPGGIWPKNNNTCKGPWVLHPYQVSSKSIQWFWRRSRKCEKFTDGWTDDGRCAMTIAHSSLWLRWAKKKKKKIFRPTYPNFFWHVPRNTHFFYLALSVCVSVCAVVTLSWYNGSHTSLLRRQHMHSLKYCHSRYQLCITLC